MNVCSVTMTNNEYGALPGFPYAFLTSIYDICTRGGHGKADVVGEVADVIYGCSLTIHS